MQRRPRAILAEPLLRERLSQQPIERQLEILGVITPVRKSLMTSLACTSPMGVKDLRPSFNRLSRAGRGLPSVPWPKHVSIWTPDKDLAQCVSGTRVV